MLSVRENLQWMSPVNTSSVQIVSALAAVACRIMRIYPAISFPLVSRRVALARLITSKANLWYLDEPLAALDKQGVDFVESCMQQHTEKGAVLYFRPIKIWLKCLRVNCV